MIGVRSLGTCGGFGPAKLSRCSVKVDVRATYITRRSLARCMASSTVIRRNHASLVWRHLSFVPSGRVTVVTVFTCKLDEGTQLLHAIFIGTSPLHTRTAFRCTKFGLLRGSSCQKFSSRWHVFFIQPLLPRAGDGTLARTLGTPGRRYKVSLLRGSSCQKFSTCAGGSVRAQREN